MKQKNNRGFTLVELIVSVAILGVIAMAAAGFLVTGTRVYRSVNYSLRLQYESQLAMAQVEDYMLDCSDGAAWSVEDADGSGVLYLVDVESGVQTAHVFRYDAGEGCIYFGTQAASSSLDSQTAAADLLAEHVQAMSVSFSGTDAGQADEAAVTLTFSRDNKTYTGTQTIALRNHPAFAANWRELWSVLHP
jgi:prepilin-type N-terminal cleavage/methylation domain-containing protein